MTALTLVPAEVSPINLENVHTEPCSVDITAGQLIRPDGTTGKWVLAGSASAGALGDPYIAPQSCKAGFPLTAAKEGTLLDLGSALDGLAFGAAVYANDTLGSLGDAAGTVSLIVGRVVAGFGHTTPNKLLRCVNL